MPGAEFVSMKKNILDESKRTDIVSVKEAYQAGGYDVESDAFKQMIMGATGFSYRDRDGIPDESGQLPTKRVRFADGQSFESRIETMDYGRALTLDTSHKKTKQCNRFTRRKDSVLCDYRPVYHNNKRPRRLLLQSKSVL